MGHFTLSALDLAVILGELLLVVAIGLWASRSKDPSASGYFLSSGKMPWWLIGSAFVATSVSSEQIVGTMGAAYRHGMGITNWEWWCLPTYLLMMVFFIPLYLRNQITTVSEFMTRRFGRGCADIYSGVMLVGYVFVFLAPVLYGGSVTFARLTGWPMGWVLIGMAASVGLYTILGGLDAVMWTEHRWLPDALVSQRRLLFWVALGDIPGGWPAMAKAVPERFHMYHPPNDPETPFLGLIVGTFGVFLFYQSTNQVMIQRVLAARSTWDGLMGIVFAGFINLIRPMVTCLLGLVVYHWIEVMKKAPSLLPDHADDTFAFALETFAPSGLRGVVLGGFLAAVMSTVSSLANSIATLFSLDVYRRHFALAADDRRLIFVGRLAAGTALALACLIAPLVEKVGIFKYFQTGVTYMATPFVSVMLLGILWKRTHYPAAMVGLVGGLLIQIGLAAAVWKFDWKLHWLYVGGIAQALTMLLIIAATLAIKAAPPAGSESLVWNSMFLRHYDDVRIRPWYQSVPFWLALYTILWTGLYVWFW
ncbi:MAG: sodium/solute symporter [Verrucomicrobiae bacterium]|nr:sodium/solute symporter [Verrucomicrobiae bacterium]